MTEEFNPVITLSLKISEVNDVLRTLGDLPTKTNAYPLMMIIKGQAESQVAGLQPDKE